MHSGVYALARKRLYPERRPGEEERSYPKTQILGEAIKGVPTQAVS